MLFTCLRANTDVNKYIHTCIYLYVCMFAAFKPMRHDAPRSATVQRHGCGGEGSRCVCCSVARVCVTTSPPPTPTHTHFGFLLTRGRWWWYPALPIREGWSTSQQCLLCYLIYADVCNIDASSHSVRYNHQPPPGLTNLMSYVNETHTRPHRYLDQSMTP